MRIQSGGPFREPVGALMHTSQFSVGTLSLARDLRSALRVARELGLHGVELDARRGLDTEQMSQTGIRQIRKWIGDEGLVVAAVAFPTRSGYGDADRLEGRIAATKAAMQLAHALGALPRLSRALGSEGVPPRALGRRRAVLTATVTVVASARARGSRQAQHLHRRGLRIAIEHRVDVFHDIGADIEEAPLVLDWNQRALRSVVLADLQRLGE